MQAIRKTAVIIAKYICLEPKRETSSYWGHCFMLQNLASVHLWWSVRRPRRTRPSRRRILHCKSELDFLSPHSRLHTRWCTFARQRWSHMLAGSQRWHGALAEAHYKVQLHRTQHIQISSEAELQGKYIRWIRYRVLHNSVICGGLSSLLSSSGFFGIMRYHSP